MTNYVEERTKQSKIQEFTDLLGQVSRALEKKNIGVEVSEYESQLLENKYEDWMRIQAMLRDAEIKEDIYEDFLQFPKHYVIVENEIIYDEDWETKEAEEEAKRIAMLSLTAADVERAIYQVKGIDFDDILDLVKENPAIDSKALKIEFKANNFFRGNPYVEQIGVLLGFTKKQLDEFFETGNPEKLV